MRKKVVLLLSSILTLVCLTITASAYWSDSVKVAYTSGTNYGCTMGVPDVPKTTSSTTIYFDCGYKTSWTNPTAYLVNTANPPQTRSYGATLTNGIISDTSINAVPNYYYNVKIEGAWDQLGTDTMTFRFNPS